eukprot:Tbor_TRINITY_DN6022_c0_g5::TRINITY_DN6022_c0_g5_i1::g.10630::m.10630/K12898/HNRNPF_H; heterogeneous nuclear ribonucleoprotein F/H
MSDKDMKCDVFVLNKEGREEDATLVNVSVSLEDVTTIANPTKDTSNGEEHQHTTAATPVVVPTAQLTDITIPVSCHTPDPEPSNDYENSNGSNKDTPSPVTITPPSALDTVTVSPNKTSSLLTSVLKFRGLPYSATVDDLKKFLNEFEISDAEGSIVIINQGFRKGEAFAVMASPEVAQAAKTALNRTDIGDRYVEIYTSSTAAMATAVEDLERIINNKNLILRIRGLPYNATKTDILNIFDDIPSDTIVAVDIVVTGEGRMTGVAFVEISDVSLSEKAAAHDHARVGHRYVEITVSTANDRDRVVCSNRYSMRNQFKGQHPMPMPFPVMFPPPLMPMPMMNPMMMNTMINPMMGGGMCNPMAMRCSAWDSQGNKRTRISDHVVRLQGLPSDVTEDDVGEFFTAVNVTRHGVHLVYSGDDVLTGEAYVELGSKRDVTAAMKHDGEMLRGCAVKVLKSSKEDLKEVSGPEPPAVPMPLPMPVPMPMMNPMMMNTMMNPMMRRGMGTDIWK